MFEQGSLSLHIGHLLLPHEIEDSKANISEGEEVEQHIRQTSGGTFGGY